MFALVANAAFLAVEVVGGFAFGSLALLADAAHMATDVVVLAVAYAALRITQRPPTERHTFGFARTEVLVAQAQRLAAVRGRGRRHRRGDPPVRIARRRQRGRRVRSSVSIGLIVNVVSAAALFRHAHDNINMRGAFWHLFSDALGSVGVIVAGVGVALFGAEWLDPDLDRDLAPRDRRGAWQLLRDAGRCCWKRCPRTSTSRAVRDALASGAGVEAVHHLHLWTTGSEQAAFSAHVVLGGPLSLHDAQLRAGELKHMLADRVRYRALDARSRVPRLHRRRSA